MTGHEIRVCVVLDDNADPLVVMQAIETAIAGRWQVQEVVYDGEYDVTA